MLTGALKPADARFCTLIIMFSLLVATGVGQAAGPKSAKAGAHTPPQRIEPAPVREWGPYLDVAYELTYWDKAEIKEWRERNEKELGEPLATYIASWSAKLTGPTGAPGAAREGTGQPVYRERDYLRLAVAQTIDYLQSENLESLNDAERLLARLKGNATMPEVAFWIGFVEALQALENNDAPQFVDRVYSIWNNAVMYIEQGSMAGAAKQASGSRSIPFLYRNIVNLVAKRAIIDRKMARLDALGPLFLMLKERNLEESASEGRYLTTLVTRIGEGFTAPDSDRYRLNFSVAVIEARRLQKVAMAKLDSQGMSEESWRDFDQSRHFYDYALRWAASPRSSGTASTVTEYLDTTSFAIQRLGDNEKAPAYRLFAMLPSHDGSSTLLKAMDIYNDIAAYGGGGWEKAGYTDRALYLKATHRLWRSIMELALWSGDFYLAKLNAATDQQNTFSEATPLQAVLNSYLDFLAAQTSREFPDVIPDSAYFGGAEAAEKLAHAYLRAYTYSTESAVYNLWFIHRLQATELFPLDPREVAQTASILRRDGRYNLFLDYFLPLADRFRQSAAVKQWLAGQRNDVAAPIREYAGAINVVFATAGSGDGKKPGGSSVGASIGALREELQRKPDHPVHKLLKSFYMEELKKSTPYTLLLKDPNLLNRGL